MILIKTVLLVVATIVLFPSSSAGQKRDKRIDTVYIKSYIDEKKNSTGPQIYSDLIKGNVKTEKGMFTIHQIKDRYFFEIPDTIFKKEILVVNRIVKAATEARNNNQLLGYAGDQIGQSVIEFVKGPLNKVFIKRISFQDKSQDSSDNGLFRAVINSNMQPIVAAFDIKAIGPDSSSVVIDLTDYINGDNEVLFFGGGGKIKQALALGALQPERSYIEDVKVYPFNLEIQTVKTYANSIVSSSFSTYTLNSSFVMLPSILMKTRAYDKRVGYFSERYLDFDIDPQGVIVSNLIRRWRIEPREQDIAKYMRGELVEPKKPIVFYIDPSTPQKWIPYLIKGVNNWQKAFESAGFKNAIYARPAPTKEEDSTWSLEDTRFSAIVYKPSTVQNAYGPGVTDPRTGEILESHVQWFHNVMQLLKEWYFVQTAATNPSARKKELEDSTMGELISFVITHEIGHSLGLKHNFRASSSVKVDSLRSSRWLSKNGICPSIMDYARFNYVAQPEDSIKENQLICRIGVYDLWAIEWGYKYFPSREVNTEEAETNRLRSWVTRKLNDDSRLLFEDELETFDPRNQSEDLGDDAIKASEYGIKNLRQIMQHLEDWSYEPNQGFERLEQTYNSVLTQYKRYLQHVTRYVNGVLYNPSITDQNGKVWEYCSREKQKSAINFLQDNLFKTPMWLFSEALFSKIGGGPSSVLLQIQDNCLKQLLTASVISGLQLFSLNQPNKFYGSEEFLNDLKTGIFEEILERRPVDFYRRSLQKAYVTQLIILLSPSKADVVAINSDLLSVIKGHLKSLLDDINIALPYYKENLVRLHLMDIKGRILSSLNLNQIQSKPY